MRLLLVILSLTFISHAQPTVFRLNTIAGSFPLGNDGPAAQALLGQPRFVAFDSAGILYISDTDNNMIRRIERDGRITAVAGTGVRGNTGDGGPALRATFDRPRGIAFDGNLLYVGDDYNNRVRVINLQTGVVENYAGTGTSGFSGDGGPAGNATFFSISGLAVDNQGNLLIVDRVNHRLRRVNKTTGIITTVAGTGLSGSAGEGGSAAGAALAGPEAVVVDDENAIYVACNLSSRVVRIDGTTGVLRRFAGSISSNSIRDNVQAVESFMFSPVGLAVDRRRRVVYISDYDVATIREVNIASGIIATAAGDALRPLGFSGDGGAARGAIMAGPWGLAVDAQGNLVIADIDNYRLRRVDARGDINTIAGRPPFGGDNGPAEQAILFQPSSAIPDGQGGRLVADTGNCVIRRINREGVISTFAGTPNICFGAANSDGRPARQAIFSEPTHLARDRAGNLYISDGSRVRKISADTGGISTFARNLRGAGGMVLDATEQFLYIAESFGHRITRVAVATGSAEVYAGSIGGTSGFAGDGGLASDARFNTPTDVAFDSFGNLFVADALNFRIRRIDSQRRVSTVAGNGTLEADADGAALEKGIGAPSTVLVDAAGAIYFTSFQRVMRVNRGQLEVLAGATAGGLAGDGGFGPQARFNVPYSLRWDGATLLVADTFNHRIRTMTPVRAATLAALSGDGQSAAVRMETREPMVVQVRLPDGTPAPGVPVAFTASNGATLSAARVVTEVDGRATVRVTMPGEAGAVSVVATVEGLPAVRFNLTATATVTPMPTRPSISAAIAAGSFGAATRIAPGTWMEIYGSNFAPNQRQWSGSDFQGTNAPTSLGGVRVLVAGRPAFIQLIAPGQINAQVPDGIGTGAVKVQVINAEGTSEEFEVMAAERAPALLAPPAFRVDGKQYVAAQFADGAFVGPENLIAGAAFRPARAGDRVILYGIGFGATAPAIPAGQIVGQANSLADLVVRIGGQPAPVEYGGLAGGFVGLYQFNVVVPAQVPAGDAPLTVTVGGVPVTQPLVLTVRE